MPKKTKKPTGNNENNAEKFKVKRKLFVSKNKKKINSFDCKHETSIFSFIF